MQCYPVLSAFPGLTYFPNASSLPAPPPNRFDSLAKRINELQPPTETQSESSSAESSSASSSDASSAKDDERGASKTEMHPESSDGAGKRGEGSIEGKDEQGKPPQESGEGSSKKPETEEKLRQEVEMLEDKRTSIMVEMFTCSQFHHVFEDSNADDGLVPDMPDEEAEGGGEATSGKGSGAGDGDSSGMAEKEKVEESREQPPADESAGK